MLMCIHVCRNKQNKTKKSISRHSTNQYPDSVETNIQILQKPISRHDTNQYPDMIQRQFKVAYMAM